MITKTKGIIIPARLESSRCSRKLLREVQGKPVLWYTYQVGLKANFGDVYVATDSNEIEDVCGEYDMKVVKTGNCVDGTTRCFEANKQLNLDYIVNLQGDSPLVRPEDISRMTSRLPYRVTIGYPTPEKVIFKSYRFTRKYLNHIGVYGFRREALDHFGLLADVSTEENLEQTKVSRVGGWKVVKVDQYDDYFSIDTEEDYERFRRRYENV